MDVAVDEGIIGRDVGLAVSGVEKADDSPMSTMTPTIMKAFFFFCSLLPFCCCSAMILLERKPNSSSWIKFKMIMEYNILER